MTLPLCVKPHKPLRMNLPSALRALLAVALSSVSTSAATPDAAKSALVRAVKFYHDKAASHGGYVYRYSADFTLREAEGIPGPDTIWIQPPGTPADGHSALAVEHGHARGVVPAVLHPAQGVDDDVAGIALPDVADDSAHGQTA